MVVHGRYLSDVGEQVTDDGYREQGKIASDDGQRGQYQEWSGHEQGTLVGLLGLLGTRLALESDKVKPEHIERSEQGACIEYDKDG